MKKILEGNRLFIARARIVLQEEKGDQDMATAHYNKVGYRLFYKINDNKYLDLLDNTLYPVLNEKLKQHQLFIFNPKPFWTYAHCLRIAESLDDVKEYAKFVDEHFNKYLHDENRWFEAKDFVHKVHHKNDEMVLDK